MFKRVSGTRDILPDQSGWWQNIAGTSRTIFSSYNYKEIRPPLLEEAALFNRSLGENTEIVQKQMFIIKRDEDVFALRPEGTASVVRAYLENSLDKTLGFAKLYYMGPMFRAERPQKGRLRQFHHIGCETIGSFGPLIDIEVIALADALLRAFGITGYTVCLNSLGCAQDKENLHDFLKKSLKDRLPQLCVDCRDRYDRNVLRILDCKNESCQKICAELKIGHAHLCRECAEHFAQVRQGLDDLHIAYTVMPQLVRGLDYYNRTVFEFKHPGLGPQQDALGAGGRYDGLVKELGGPDLGAIGFAFGVERLALVFPVSDQQQTSDLVYLITLGDQARKQSMTLLSGLRAAGIPSDTDFEERSLKGAMRKANDLGARFVLILGDDELAKNIVTVKNMKDSSQFQVAFAELAAYLKKSL